MNQWNYYLNTIVAVIPYRMQLKLQTSRYDNNLILFCLSRINLPFQNKSCFICTKHTHAHGIQLPEEVDGGRICRWPWSMSAQGKSFGVCILLYCCKRVETNNCLIVGKKCKVFVVKLHIPSLAVT